VLTRREIATPPGTSITTAWLWGQVHLIFALIAALSASFRLHHRAVGSWFTLLKECAKSPLIAAK
jgi:hypothetical protein